MTAVAAWGRREPSSLRGARIIGPRRSGAVGAEDPAGQQQRRLVVRAGKTGFGDGGGREKSKGKGKGKGKEKEKGKKKGKGNDENETVTIALLDEGGYVGDMSEADLEAAIEALFAQLASDLEADADVDGTGFAAGDVDVELDDDELAALQVELDAALAEMTAEVEKEGEGEGEVDEEERALVAELGLEEEEGEEEEEEDEEWEGGLREQTEGSQEMGEVMAKGTASGEGEQGEAGKKEEGVHDVAGAMAGAIAAGAIAGSGMGRREAVAGEKEQRMGSAEHVESGAIVGQGQDDPMGKRSDKSTQKGGSLRDDDWQGEEEEDAEEEESSGAREGARREVQLQRWQLKKLALAVQKGRRHINVRLLHSHPPSMAPLLSLSSAHLLHTSHLSLASPSLSLHSLYLFVKALAAEAHLPRRDVLAFLRHPPDISALFPDLPSPSTPPAPGEGAGEQEAAVVAQSGAAGAQGEGRGVGEKGGGEGKGADRLGMSEEGKKEWQERWKKGKRIRQEHLSTMEAVYQRSKYPTVNAPLLFPFP
ncbi:unnamed protein product [Closterium sp. Naga37s-1]|nr:unnamed protein product [Closterium sp. Naga37s-1]